MIRLFADPAGEIQANAVAAVAYLCQSAVPALIEALGASDLRIRNNASRALARIGSSAKAGLPKLRQLAGDAEPAYSPWAERAIRRILSEAFNEPLPNPTVERDARKSGARPSP